MRIDVVKYLACPVDGASLSLADGAVMENGRVHTGELVCTHGHRYPITEFVPRLLVQPETGTGKQITQSSFSAKWKMIPGFGFDEASRSFYVNWYLERHGYKTIDALRAHLSSARLILDAGCGVGRDSSVFAENAPQAEVFGIDLTDAVDAAYKNAGHLPNLTYIQADLQHPPFQQAQFDYISSDQVLHHTPNTEVSFKGLIPFLKPGGQVAIYVYKVKAPMREYADDFLRAHYTRASEQETIEFSRAMTLLGKALTELNATLVIEEDIPILGFTKGEVNLQRWFYDNIMKVYWNPTLDMDTNILTNFDWYHPLHAFRHTPEEVQGWFADVSLKMVNFDIIPSGISARGQLS